MNRVGIGYDVHRLVEGRRLVLGGVEIPHHKGLDGHSDADVLAHAIADAVLGAVGAYDIGHYFPPEDNAHKDIDSMEILKRAREVADGRGFDIENVDSALIAEAPKILPHIDAMKERIAAALEITPAQVGIKATTSEGMGFVGRGEGMAAHAVCCVVSH